MCKPTQRRKTGVSVVPDQRVTVFRNVLISGARLCLAVFRNVLISGAWLCLAVFRNIFISGARLCSVSGCVQKCAHLWCQAVFSVWLCSEMCSSLVPGCVQCLAVFRNVLISGARLCSVSDFVQKCAHLWCQAVFRVWLCSEMCSSLVPGCVQCLAVFRNVLISGARQAAAGRSCDQLRSFCLKDYLTSFWLKDHLTSWLKDHLTSFWLKDHLTSFWLKDHLTSFWLKDHRFSSLLGTSQLA